MASIEFSALPAHLLTSAWRPPCMRATCVYAQHTCGANVHMPTCMYVRMRRKQHAFVRTRMRPYLHAHVRTRTNPQTLNIFFLFAPALCQALNYSCAHLRTLSCSSTMEIIKLVIMRIAIVLWNRRLPYTSYKQRETE